MRTLDVVLLTADRYIAQASDNVLLNNVLEENRLVENALKQEGFRIATKSWSDPEFDWSSTIFVLVRTPWDYFERSKEFKRWLNDTMKKTTFINSAGLIHWNMDKSYLQELEQKGIRIPKTFFLKKGVDQSLKTAIKMAQNAFGKPCGTWVLKPCVAAGAFHTYTFQTAKVDDFEKRFKKLTAEADFMLQEFQESIVSRGEISLILFEHEYSHAVLKKAKAGDFRVQDDFGGTVEPYNATQDEIEFAKNVIGACHELPLFSRVDLLTDNEGRLALAELEIFEPELWFRFQPQAAEVMVQKLKKRAAQFNERPLG